jgi:hypothetical protein
VEEPQPLVPAHEEQPEVLVPETQESQVREDVTMRTPEFTIPQTQSQVAHAGTGQFEPHMSSQTGSESSQDSFTDSVKEAMEFFGDAPLRCSTPKRRKVDDSQSQSSQPQEVTQTSQPQEGSQRQTQTSQPQSSQQQEGSQRQTQTRQPQTGSQTETERSQSQTEEDMTQGSPVFYLNPQARVSVHQSEMKAPPSGSSTEAISTE